jgi:hypothetical protein
MDFDSEALSMASISDRSLSAYWAWLKSRRRCASFNGLSVAMGDRPL